MSRLRPPFQVAAMQEESALCAMGEARSVRATKEIRRAQHVRVRFVMGKVKTVLAKEAPRPFRHAQLVWRDQLTISHDRTKRFQLRRKNGYARARRPPVFEIRLLRRYPQE